MEVNDSPAPTADPASFLTQHLGVFLDRALHGPVLDLACGGGHNGVYLAAKGLTVECCDRSPEALEQARGLAKAHGVDVKLWQVDLERTGVNPLPLDAYGAILVFRYLHRPLMPHIREAMREGGILIYETFTVEQPRFGKPRNPDFLLKPGELRSWFEDWEILDAYEGIREEPKRAVAQILCRKPKVP
jgi:SAM-dependent methyltransferase